MFDLIKCLQLEVFYQRLRLQKEVEILSFMLSVKFDKDQK